MKNIKIERIELKKALKGVGYKDNTINLYLRGTGKKSDGRPHLNKAIEMEEVHGISCTVWKNISLHIVN